MPPRIHDLELLGDDLSVPVRIKAELAVLNPVFHEVRYPDLTNRTTPADIFTETLAQRHFDTAERVMKWLSKQLVPSSTQP